MGEYYKDSHRYDDIIGLERPVSKNRKPMPRIDRAAQFAAFAALSGHEEAIQETARLTKDRLFLTEEELSRINEVLFYLSEHLSEHLPISISYFRKDNHKEGGNYLTDLGYIKKIDSLEKKLLLDNGIVVPMEDIVFIEITKPEL